MFLITGPGSPSVLSNMMVSIEQHVDWINDSLGYMGERQLGLIEASEQAEADWVAHVNEVGNTTLYPPANSWYMGSNVPGKPRVFMPYIGGVPVYREKCDEVAANRYEGCALSVAGRRKGARWRGAAGARACSSAKSDVHRGRPGRLFLVRPHCSAIEVSSGKAPYPGSSFMAGW